MAPCTLKVYKRKHLVRKSKKDKEITITNLKRRIISKTVVERYKVLKKKDVISFKVFSCVLVLALFCLFAFFFFFFSFCWDNQLVNGLMI